MALTIPTCPDLKAGNVASVADFSNLAACCTFLLNKPVVRVHDGGSGTAIGTSATTIPFSVKDFDTDGMWATGSNTRLTVQTPGWYKFKFGISIASAGHVFIGKVLSTTGANNPAGSGIVSASHWPGYAVGTGTLAVGMGTSGIWPFYLYALDWLAVSVTADVAGGTLDTTVTASFFEMEYVSN